ncbi:MAG: hypothetical protein HRT44_03260 [Bdellovibrionales bacterium]|nr:hypothetical protein [Bdellovibrionales bacterium]
MIRGLGVTKRIASPSVDRVTFEVNIAMGCDNVETLASMFNATDVQLGSVLRLGPQNFFTIDLQCTDSSCDSVNIAVMNNDGGERIVLGALSLDGSSTSTVRRMVPAIKQAAPNGDNHFAAEFSNYFDYIAACTGQQTTPVVNPGAQPEQPEQADPTGGSLFNNTTTSPEFSQTDPQLDPFFSTQGSL